MSRSQATIPATRRRRNPAPGVPKGQPSLFPAWDLREMLAILWRRKGILMGVIPLVMVTALLLVNRVTPQYTADALIMLEEHTPNFINLRDVMQGMRPSRANILGQMEVLRSRSLAERVVNKLHLADNALFNPELDQRRKAEAGGLGAVLHSLASSLIPDPWLEALQGPGAPRALSPEEQGEHKSAAIIDRFLNRLSVKQRGLSPVIQISYRTPDPAFSAHITNSLADIYVESQLETKFEATRKATLWLHGRLADLRLSVRSSEEAVARYRAEHGIVSTRGGKLSEERLSDLSSQYILAQSNLAEAQARYSQVRRMVESGGRRIDAAGEVMRSPFIQGLMEQETVLLRKMSELSNRYGDRHPKMINTRTELNDLRRKINAEILKIAELLKNELEVARVRAESLKQGLDKLEARAGDEGTANVTLRELEREAEANRLIYESFLARFKETSQQQDIQHADASILSRASIPSTPSQPRKRLILTLAFLAALVLAFGLVWLREHLDRGIRSAEQVEALTGVPVLAMVPLVTQGGKRSDMGAYIINEPLSSVAESVRNLQTSLRLADPDHPPRLLCLTSTTSGEGKSTLATWLARSTALQGRKVLLVDCDLRRPKLHEVLNRDNRLGLVDALTGEIPLQELIQQDDISGAHLLLGRALHGDSLKFFESESFRALLATLSERYDMVILDSPPVLAVSDARLLAHMVHATIFLVQWNATDRGAVQTAVRALASGDAHIAGVVVSQVDTRRHARYGYGDHGHYYGRYGRYYTSR